MEFLHPDIGQLLYNYGMALNGEEEVINYIDYMQFSFTTISTPGYGDIHPTTGLTKMLAYRRSFCWNSDFCFGFGVCDERIGKFKTKT